MELKFIGILKCAPKSKVKNLLGQREYYVYLHCMTTTCKHVLYRMSINVRFYLFLMIVAHEHIKSILIILPFHGFVYMIRSNRIYNFIVYKHIFLCFDWITHRKNCSINLFHVRIFTVPIRAIYKFISYVESVVMNIINLL